MKKSLNESRKRILEIISKIENSTILNENQNYLNKLLDKISKTGINSLSKEERQDLNKLSGGQNVEEKPQNSTQPNNIKPKVTKFKRTEDYHFNPKDIHIFKSKDITPDPRLTNPDLEDIDDDDLINITRRVEKLWFLSPYEIDPIDLEYADVFGENVRDIKIIDSYPFEDDYLYIVEVIYYSHEDRNSGYDN